MNLVEALRAIVQDDFGREVVEVDASDFEGRIVGERVEIRSGMDDQLEAVVLIHELAHILLGHDRSARGDTPAERRMNERVAEEVVEQFARRQRHPVLLALSGQRLRKMPGRTPGYQALGVALRIHALVEGRRVAATA